MLRPGDARGRRQGLALLRLRSPPLNVATLIEMSAAGAPDAPAVTSRDRTLTRTELLAASRDFATRLGDLDVAAVLYLAANELAFPIAAFGAAFAGIPFVPINYRLSAEQLAGALDDLAPFALIADAANRQVAESLGADVVLGTTEVEASLEAPGSARSAPSDPDAIAVLLLTSGTTSAPKRVVLRHRHVFSYMVSNVAFASAEPDDAALVVVPPYHIAGVANLLSNIYSGRRIVYLQQFSAADWLEHARAEQITHAMLVPTMLVRILDELDAGGEPPPSLRAISYGGAKVSRAVVERALERFPAVEFVNAYGLTETSSTIALLGPQDHRLAQAGDPAALARLGSVGRLLPGIEVEIRDDDDAPLATGAGAIWVRGDQVSGEYLEGSRLDSDGWFPTRDVGWVDDAGYLFVQGRGDDTIIRGGENIAPDEIEDALAEHPAVERVAAFGVPDEEWGQRIAVAVVSADGEPASAEELREWTRERLRGSKTPDFVWFREELPYSETGKLLRRVLVAEFLASPPGVERGA
jgi:acyl-CoA synthetase (AMP-forming)/AMP-acid ligase II